MHGPPSSTASGSGSSDRNLAPSNPPIQDLPGAPSTSSQNALLKTPQGALYTQTPSETVYPYSGGQIDTRLLSADTSAVTSRHPGVSIQSHVQSQPLLHGPPIQPHPQPVDRTGYANYDSLDRSGLIGPRVDARKLSPEPPRIELPQSWDRALINFLARAGLTQALKGLESDMLVLNPNFERNELPSALEDLKQTLNRILETPASEVDLTTGERKLDYVHRVNNSQVLTPSSMTKSISRLLSRKRARNDASNQSEFLVNKRSRSETEDSEHPSTARVDAKLIDRDDMMKFDIAKNDEGPLRRTMQASSSLKDDTKDLPTFTGVSSGEGNTGRGIDERLINLEEHLAIRYVPSAPVALPVRLQMIEEHIVNLEREYPPWAALHFNQPRRGWPAPPRPTPIIVPSHLTSTTAQKEFSASLHEDAQAPSFSDHPTPGDNKGKGRAQSSLQRAVLERLEVQKAMSDMKGPAN